jgi:hypothetical protein
MLRIYRHLIRSHLDYGPSLSEKILPISHPIHHSGIRLSAGTTGVESPSAISFRRKTLLCSYAAKLSALKKHSSYEATHRPSLHITYAYMLSRSANRAVGIRQRDSWRPHLLVSVAFPRRIHFHILFAASFQKCSQVIQVIYISFHRRVCGERIDVVLCVRWRLQRCLLSARLLRLSMPS